MVIKYNEPPEARKPKTRWRLYPFKGEQAMCKLFDINKQEDVQEQYPNLLCNSPDFQYYTKAFNILTVVFVIRRVFLKYKQSTHMA